MEQNDFFTVRLINHKEGTGTPAAFDIYVESLPTPGAVHQICNPTKDGSPVETDPNGLGTYECKISSAITAGQYRVYSTKAGLTSEIAEFQTLTVEAGSTPRVEVTGGSVWAANSKIEISLLNHQIPDQDFDVYFNDGSGEIKIAGPLTADPAPSFDYKIPFSVGTSCLPGAGTGCRIFSRSISNTVANVNLPDNSYAQTEIFVTQPEVRLFGGVLQYAQGSEMGILLVGHTPNTEYDIRITSGVTGTTLTPPQVYRVTTDSAGQFEMQRVAIPDTGSWPDGTYNITSHQITNLNLAEHIAQETITVSTPSGPFLTIFGGTTWPIDSLINIKALQHDKESHYMNFGSWRVPAPEANNTFIPAGTGVTGSADLDYRIPISAAIGSPTVHKVETFKTAGNLTQADLDVTVLPIPVIQVLEGDKVLPNSKITIRISNHIPNAAYKIFYGKTVGIASSVGKDLSLTLITDANGVAQGTYDLSKLPINPPPNFADPFNCNCYGVPYEMYSQATFNDEQTAFTQLTIDSADLAITKVELPSTININTSVPVTVTVQNLKPITISRYFDIDLYLNPSPVVPTAQTGKFNFPGDVKHWKNFVAPNGQPGDTFTITDTFFINQYNDQNIYGHADTSDFIVAEPSEGNNIGLQSFTVSCNPTPISDDFSSSLASSWQTRVYGPDTETPQPPQTSGGQLRLNSDGKWAFGSNDDASSRGFLYLHQTSPVTSSEGLDVVVQLVQASQASQYAAAGIQLRNSAALGDSLRADLSLYWENGLSQYRVEVASRKSQGASMTADKDNQLVSSLGTPVWLRIERVANSDQFRFYYLQQTAAPGVNDWGTAYATVNIPMSDQVYVGLFNASYSNNTYTTSIFDNFSYTDKSSCAAGQTTPVQIPPGVTLCTDLLVENGFEKAPAQAWRLGVSENVNLNPSSTESHSGLLSLDASTFDGSFNKPFFYQQFTMPSWVISSTTTFGLNMYRNVDSLSSGDDANDQFYAVVSTSPVTATRVTSPTLIAQGTATGGWEVVNEALPPLASTNLETYANQPLYIYFYNNSNSTCSSGPCHSTRYLFDDVQLTSCTTQPAPANVTSLVQGSVTLHRLGGSSEKISGVKVWAYTEGGQLHQTFTDQFGNYKFYNLDPGEYIVYSEHFIEDAQNNDLEHLATNTSVILGANQTLTFNLDLYTIN